MSIRRFWISLGGLVAALTFVASAAVPTLAATSAVGSANGLKVSPVTTNVVINPGESQTIKVFVQNVTQATVQLQVVVNDFTASDNETGAPALLLDPGQYAPSHSLKRFVAPIDNVTLAPGEQKTVNVTVAIPKTAVGGGYYGAVRFAPVSTASNNNVTLSASVGSLILVRVPGKFTEQLKLLSFDVRDAAANVPRVIFISGKNLVATARFQNLGDVQEQPFGKLLLKQGNTQVASYELNNTTPRGNVLPGSIRKFTVKLDKVGAFGRYTIVGNFGYGESGQLVTGQTTFYVVPLVMILLIVLVIAAILFAIFVLPRLVRAYNRRVIARSGRR